MSDSNATRLRQIAATLDNGITSAQSADEVQRLLRIFSVEAAKIALGVARGGAFGFLSTFASAFPAKDDPFPADSAWSMMWDMIVARGSGDPPMHRVSVGDGVTVSESIPADTLGAVKADARRHVDACNSIAGMIEPPPASTGSPDAFAQLVKALTLGKSQGIQAAIMHLARDPDASDRKIADAHGVSPTTVGTYRKRIDRIYGRQQLERKTGEAWDAE